MNEIIIKVRDFSFKYRDSSEETLKSISFDIKKGSFVSIVGENGAGKSTLCNALVGLIPHYFNGKYDGSIQIKDKMVDEHTISELSNTIGLVFQNPFNQLSYTTDTVEQELAYGLCNRGVCRDEMISRVKEVSRLMNIEHILHKNPLELSGGQVQRVALGSIFIQNPEILVLDECTTQLDPLGSKQIFDIIKELNKKGVTVVMVDHDMERVAKYSDQVITLNKGNMIGNGSPENIFTNSFKCVGIDKPDYMKIGYKLYKNGYISSEINLTKKQLIENIKEAISENKCS